LFPSLEQIVLTHAVALEQVTGEYQRLRDLLSRDVDGERLIDMAVKEGLACHLYKNLKRSGSLEALSNGQIARLKTLYHQTVLFNLKLISDLKRVLHRFNQQNISVVILQGMALLELVYKKDIGLRPMTDIDLWAPRGHFTRLIPILMEEGFIRDPLYPNTFVKGSTTLDFHTHILWADRIKARRWLITRNQDDIYDKAGTIRIEGREVLCPDRPDLIIYLCLHALKHNLDRLIQLVDIKHLLTGMEAFEWQRLIGRARDLGQEKALVSILYLLQCLFDFKPPPQVKENMKMREPGSLEKWALRRRAEGDAMPLWAPLLLLFPPRGGMKRLSYFLETLFPGRKVLRQIFTGYPEAGAWRLYWMRVLQILLKFRTLFSH
jgi:hypothetical protein